MQNFRFNPLDVMIQKRFISTNKQISKKGHTEQLMHIGERYLQKKNSSFLRYFNQACKVEPNNRHLWMRQGKNLFHYGRKFHSKKFLSLAFQRFKVASKITASFDSFFFAAKSLYELGELEERSCYFWQAKEKLDNAFSYFEQTKPEQKHAFYWMYGNIWISLGRFSQEAIDIKYALDDFRKALLYFKSTHPLFWHDFGKAYVELGLLINDNALYHRGIQHFFKALSFSPHHLRSLAAVADAFTQLYINTLDEYYFSQANLYFSKIKRPDAFHLLDWAALLCEGGKASKDCRKLALSVDKCVEAFHLEEDNPSVIAQQVESLSYLGLYTQKFALLEQAEELVMDWVEKVGDDIDLWYAYGVTLLCYGHYFEDVHFYDLAMEKVQEGLDLDSSSAELWHLAGNIQMHIHLLTDDIASLRLACYFLSKAIERKPAYPPLYFDYAKSLAKLGDASGSTQEFEKSLFFFEQIFTTQKNLLLSQPDWLFFYALTLDGYGNQRDEEKYVIKAIEIFWQLLLLDASYPNIYFRLGSAFLHLAELTSDQSYFEKAFSYLLIASQKDPENDAIFLEWGLALASFANHVPEFKEEEKRNYYLDAEKKLLQAGHLGSAQTYYHLSCLYSLMGKLDLAFSFLQKAKKMDVLPPLEELLEDEWLQALRETDFFCNFVQSLSSKDQK